MSETGLIESRSDFASSPAEQQRRWGIEINAARKEVKKWHDLAKKLNDRFLDKRRGDSTGESRLNLFTANIQTQRSMLYGKTPRVDVVRRFDDQNDAVARVASEILERLLNTSIEEGSDSYAEALALALDDRLLCGLGNVRVLYEAEFSEQEEVPAQVDDAGNETAPAYTPAPEKASEEVRVEYTHWKDQLWSPARTWSEIRWWAFRVQMTRDQAAKRFGKAKAALIPLRGGRKGEEKGDTERADPWSRCEVFEIWSKEDKKVYWYADGASEILDMKDDPLGLEGFFPCPRPLVANLTTDAFMPRPDYIFAQDLYDEIDLVTTRIAMLERAVKVVGVYNGGEDSVRRLLTEGFDNDLVPVDNWAMFAQQGGLKGQIDWLPLDQVVAALTKLQEYRAECVKLLYEVTGMSDILRGQAAGAATATEQAIKAKFASVRLQSFTDEFARFASDILRIKAEVICKLCDDEYLIAGSNIQMTPDAPLATQAIQLLRDERLKFRVEVKPENIAQADWDQLKAERTAYLAALTQFLQAAGPLIGSQPEAGPFLIELLRWGMAGFRGASSIEQVLDQAIAAMKQKIAQPPPPPPPDPKVEAQKQKAQLDVQVAKAKAGVEIGKLQQKNQIDQAKLGIDAQRAQMSLQKMAAEARMKALHGDINHQGVMEAV